MASQCDMVLDHLKNHGSISHKEAEELYGIARLAARVNDLRRLGVAISTRTVTGKNRRDETVHCARYYLSTVDKMILDDAVEILPADPDSQYRLRRCKCGSNNAAYVRGADDLWRVRCFDCGETRGMDETRHGAQMKWNGVAKK